MGKAFRFLLLICLPVLCFLGGQAISSFGTSVSSARAKLRRVGLWRAFGGYHLYAPTDIAPGPNGTLIVSDREGERIFVREFFRSSDRDSFREDDANLSAEAIHEPHEIIEGAIPRLSAAETVEILVRHTHAADRFFIRESLSLDHFKDLNDGVRFSEEEIRVGQLQVGVDVIAPHLIFDFAGFVHSRSPPPALIGPGLTRYLVSEFCLVRAIFS